MFFAGLGGGVAVFLQIVFVISFESEVVIPCPGDDLLRRVSDAAALHPGSRRAGALHFCKYLGTDRLVYWS
jgi:hypothetical protein